MEGRGVDGERGGWDVAFRDGRAVRKEARL